MPDACRGADHSGRITLRCHRSFSVAAVDRLPSALYRPTASTPNPGERDVIRSEDFRLEGGPSWPACVNWPHRQVVITWLSLPGTALAIGGNQTAHSAEQTLPPGCPLSGVTGSRAGYRYLEGSLSGYNRVTPSKVLPGYAHLLIGEIIVIRSLYVRVCLFRCRTPTDALLLVHQGPSRMPYYDATD